MTSRVTMVEPQAPRVIYWHRTDLRLHDSPALHAALDLKPECLWQIWTWDSHYVYRARVGPNRWSFLLASLRALSASITALNPDSQLFVLREPPQTLLPKLFRAWRPTHLVYERDTDAYARDRDAAVDGLARAAGVRVVTRTGRTLFDPDELAGRNGGRPTMSMAQVQRAVKKGPGLEVPRPPPPPESLPDPGEVGLDGIEQERPTAVPDLNAGSRGEGGEGEKTYAAGLAGPKGDFGVPDMGELGLADDAATTGIEGGEARALEALGRVLADVEYVATFEKPAKAPTEWDPPATTVLSPHLHFGTLGVREFWWGVKDAVARYERGKKGKGKASGMPVNLEGQLLFREMYFAAQAPLGHRFAQSHNNPQCRHIPWHLPSKIDPATGLSTGDYAVDSPAAERWFLRWRAGATGFPWIDALMRQLRRTGWVEHLGRHALACFLTRGGCRVHWERGAQVFEELLVDHEVACNAGNWMWLACAAFYSQFHRCYSPVAFPRRWDPEGRFVRRWVPELEGYDKKFVYEPWKAPIADQRRWGCRVEEYDEGVHGGGEGGAGSSYPKPMFDFDERRRVCIDAMKKAYDVGLYGDDRRVLDGTWRELFDDDAEGVVTGGAPKRECEADDGEGEFGSGGNGDEKGRKAESKATGGGAAKAGQKRQSGGSRQGTLDGIVKKSRRT